MISTRSHKNIFTTHNNDMFSVCESIKINESDLDLVNAFNQEFSKKHKIPFVSLNNIIFYTFDNDIVLSGSSTDSIRVLFSHYAIDKKDKTPFLIFTSILNEDTGNIISDKVFGIKINSPDSKIINFTLPNYQKCDILNISDEISKIQCPRGIWLDFTQFSFTK